MTDVERALQRRRSPSGLEPTLPEGDGCAYHIDHPPNPHSWLFFVVTFLFYINDLLESGNKVRLGS